MPAPRRRPAAVVGLGAVVLGLGVAGAATAGRWSLEERHYGSFNLNRNRGAITLPPRPKTTGDGERGSSGHWWLLSDLRLLGAALLLAAALGIAAWLWHRWKQFKPETPQSATQVAGTGGMLVDAEPALPPLEAAAQTALQSLAGITDTDDAIVAAWVAIERGAAQTGVARRPSQTATEFTVTVLSRTNADPDAIRILRGLYLRARFSKRATTAADVAEAGRCVEALAERWALGPIRDDAPPAGPRP